MNTTAALPVVGIDVANAVFRLVVTDCAAHPVGETSAESSAVAR